MLGSVDYKFVLLCNHKTGTNSLQDAFRKYAQITVGRSPRWKHINYREFKEIFGNYFESHGCEIYIVVRDPVDVLFSWYRYRSREELLGHENYTGNITFIEFIKSWSSEDPQPYALNDFMGKRSALGTGIEFCLTDAGDLAPVNYIRFEDIDKLASLISKKIGEQVNLPRKNISPIIYTDLDRDKLLKIDKIAWAMEQYINIEFLNF
jgi:hypothetical protein